MEGLWSAEPEVGLVPAAASDDVAFAAGLAVLVNEVYAVAEEGLWLDGWYPRSGYHLVRTDRPEKAYPQLTPLLATACDLRIYHRALPPRPCPTRHISGAR